MADRSGLRQRQEAPFKPLWSKDGPDYDPELPYGSKVNLARRKKPDAWWVKYVEVRIFLVFASLSLGLLQKFRSVL